MSSYENKPLPNKLYKMAGDWETGEGRAAAQCWETILQPGQGEAAKVLGELDALAKGHDEILSPLACGLLADMKVREATWKKRESAKAARLLAKSVDERRFDFNKRWAFREEIAGIGKPAVPMLIVALDSGRQQIRENAASLLGEMKVKTAAKQLCMLLRNLSEDGRQAARAVGKIGKPAMRHLIPNLEIDKDLPGYDRSVTLLGEIGKPAIRALIGEVREGRNIWKVSHALEEIGKPALPQLHRALRRLQSININSFSALVDAVGKIGDPASVPFLAELLSSAEYTYQGAAAKALGGIKHPDSVVALVGFLETSEEYLPRRTAVESLGNIGDEAAVPVLLKLLWIETRKSSCEDIAFALVKLGRGQEAVDEAFKIMQEHADRREGCTGLIAFAQEKMEQPLWKQKNAQAGPLSGIDDLRLRREAVAITRRRIAAQGHGAHAIGVQKQKIGNRQPMA